MTEENKQELKPDLESEFISSGITAEDIQTAIADAETPEKPKRRTRKKRAVIEGVTVPEAVGYCSECGHAVYKDDKECRGCGARFNDSGMDELVKCPHCGLTIDLEGYRGHFKCPSCGGACYAED